MNYTVVELKIAYQAGRQNIPFHDLVRVLAYIESRAKPSAKPAVKVRRKNYKEREARKRGKLTLMITGYLSKKGSKGAHADEIAKALKTKKQNVVAWFYGTGKKLIKTGEIKKTGKNTFAYVK